MSQLKLQGTPEQEVEENLFFLFLLSFELGKTLRGARRAAYILGKLRQILKLEVSFYGGGVLETDIRAGGA